MTDKDYELLERFIEGAKESYEKVENHSYTFIITISRAYQISKIIEKLLKEQDNLIEAAYSKGFTDGQNNMLEAISEGM